MRYVSLFAGVGGFDLALNRLGHECVYANDFDKYAAQTYNKNFKLVEVTTASQTRGEAEKSKSRRGFWEYAYDNSGRYSGEIDTTSITEVNANDIPDHDLLVGGFPCQAFSIAGKRAGFNDTRGTLFFDIARIIKKKRTKYLLLENVKGLLSHDSGRTFKTILSTLTELGYDIQTMVLNSKNFGVPQNRERVFIIGNLRGKPRPKVFPITSDSREDVAINAEGEPSENEIAGTLTVHYTKNQHGSQYVAEEYDQNGRIKIGTLRTHKDGNGFREMKSGLAPTIPARAREDGSGQPVIKVLTNIYPSGSENGDVLDVSGISKTLKSGETNNPKFGGIGSSNSPKIMQDMKIRRLTPLECLRLQGFPDDWFDVPGLSDTQKYKQAGNAVTVNVIEEIMKRFNT